LSPALASDLVRNALWTAVYVAAPFLCTALIVGLTVGLLQAVTQVQEQAVGFLAKLFALLVVTFACLPWAMGQLVRYLAGLLAALPSLVRS